MTAILLPISCPRKVTRIAGWPHVHSLRILQCLRTCITCALSWRAIFGVPRLKRVRLACRNSPKADFLCSFLRIRGCAEMPPRIDAQCYLHSLTSRISCIVYINASCNRSGEGPCLASYLAASLLPQHQRRFVLAIARRDNNRDKYVRLS